MAVNPGVYRTPANANCHIVTDACRGWFFSLECIERLKPLLSGEKEGWVIKQGMLDVQEYICPLDLLFWEVL